MAYDYRKWYTTRRNRLCLEHHSVMPKGSCDECRKIAKGRPQIYYNQFESDDRLDNAAYLEYQVAMQLIDIQTARYRLVEQFPETNCIPTTYDKTDISVINLIRPFYTTVFTLNNRRQNNGQPKIESVFEKIIESETELETSSTTTSSSGCFPHPNGSVKEQLAECEW